MICNEKLDVSLQYTLTLGEKHASIYVKWIAYLTSRYTFLPQTSYIALTFLMERIIEKPECTVHRKVSEAFHTELGQ